MLARVEKVWTRRTGSVATAYLSSGATQIPVANAGDFSPTGGTVVIAGEHYVYSGKHSSGDFAGNRTEYITIESPGLVAEVPVNEPVLVDPPSSDKWVLARFSDKSVSDAVFARIPHNLKSYFSQEGIRLEQDREAVEVVLDGFEYVVSDVLGKPSSFDGRDIASGTLSDGEPPASSPDATVIPGYNSLFVKWDEVSNADRVWYRVYLSEISPVDVEAANEVARTEGTMVNLGADGMGVALAPDTTYHVVVVAEDTDGSASPGASSHGEIIEGVGHAQWQAHQDAIEELNDVTIPALNVALSVAQDQVDNLEAVTIPGLSTQLAERVRVIFDSSEPSGLGASDRVVWYDTDNGYAASYWDGSSWSAYSLGSGAIAAGAIVADKIAANAIVAGKIAADAVTAATIAAGAVTADKIAANAVVAGKIAADAVTATTIAAGAVTTEELAANSVSASHIISGAVQAEHVEASAINGKTITGAMIRSAASGRRVELSQDGFVQYAADGSTVISSIGAANRFTGDIDATSMQIQDQLALRGVNNVLAKGSRLALQSSQAAPNQPLSLQAGYEEVAAPGTSWLVTMGAHLSSSETNPGWASSLFRQGSHHLGSNHYSWPTVTLPDGSVVSEWVPEKYTRVYYSGGEKCATIFSRYTASSNVPEGFYLRFLDDTVMNSSGTVAPTLVATTRLADFGWFSDFALGRAFAGPSDSSNRDKVAYAYAQRSPDGNSWSMYGAVITPSGGGVSVVHSASIPSFPRASTDEVLTGVQYGSSARMKFHGSEQYVWVFSTNKWNYVYSMDGTTRLADLEFPPALSQPYRTFAIGDLAAGDFAGFRAIEFQNIDFTMRRYTDITWSGSGSGSDPNAVWWAAYRWRNKTSVSPARHTEHGPRTSVIMRKRAGLRVSSPTLPPPAAGIGSPRAEAEDIWTFRYFLGKGTVEPSDTDLWLQTAQPGDMETQILLKEPPLSSGTNLTSSFTPFSGAASAEIFTPDLSHDSLPKLLLKADGSARLETLDLRTLEPRVSGYLNAKQLVGSGGYTALTSWSTFSTYESSRPGHLTFSYNSSTGTYTIPKDGWYRVEFNAQFASAGAGAYRLAGIFVDGSEVRRGTTDSAVLSSANAWWEGNLNSGQGVSFRVYQDSGSNLYIDHAYGSEKLTHFVIRRVSDKY